jgi:hypothetical protein
MRDGQGEHVALDETSALSFLPSRYKLFGSHQASSYHTQSDFIGMDHYSHIRERSEGVYSVYTATIPWPLLTESHAFIPSAKMLVSQKSWFVEGASPLSICSRQYSLNRPITTRLQIILSPYRKFA